MIDVQNLVKVYAAHTPNPVRAVNGVSFTARPGTVFGLLGPNGAGKTTTLRIVATVLSPTEGTAVVGGVDVRQDPAAVRRQIGFLSASTGLYDRLNPREMLGYFGALYGLGGAALEARIDALVDLFEMKDFQDRPCGVLSSGQKQKTSIARALIHDPPVLILDEPTSSLDVLVARTVVERIAALRSSKRTILLSTHIMSEAERLCDEVAFLYRSKIQASGTLAEIQGDQPLEDAFFAKVDEVDRREGASA
ncbi:MAG: ATP-binding cassette domain-containing protein [Planctomycetota bacterium]